MIPITKPFLPPISEFEEYLSGIWTRGWLTNIGPLASKLEMDLKNYLGVKHLLYVTNGTVALQMAIKALDLSGEIITTPFSFVATTSSIVWEGCKPVFVDIDKETLNIDPTKIECAITPQTSAILATHVYGNPCNIEAIEVIAKKHNLKVIYDGAHAFGVSLNGKSIFEYGDITTCSLHATKLYHTVEGGLIITQNQDLYNKMASIRNFGISGFDSFQELGINGKNSEFHAAMGLANLKWINRIIDKRKTIIELYEKNLVGLDAKSQLWMEGVISNGAYFPIILDSENQLLKIKKALEDREIFTRRYFYPSLAKSLPYLDSVKMPVTEDIAQRILCLPIFFELTEEDIDMVCRIILQT
ncbi:DegT/DnrJ/EryC1/StrS family aminotransferase [Sphingobacterium lactis]|uniref:dTDP-4-amino-4,6-dideoxygalactose transaminase n=1 Tax=Sphingobacterium lactis TaxID=797291 RepID=A0A1H6CKR3_9SPHI|nr:DegT/DnrJ/EryC1/StrS family aminotransferase [Sphingobacterium lactis]SEG73512.1 dTDP-4-amino-4,6-dideoxygalactose transaminase [Sphingobacterium lactis]